MLTKVSILQLYLRIWSKDAVSIWFRRTCWFLVAVHLVTILAFVFSEIFICSSVPYSWHFWDGLHQGSCANRAAQLYALGAINICYDVVVFILPLHNFLKLNISWRRKTGVLTIFMVGMLVTICSIVSANFLSSSLSMMQTKQILTPFLPPSLPPKRSAFNTSSKSATPPTPPGNTATPSSGRPSNVISASFAPACPLWPVSSNASGPNYPANPCVVSLLPPPPPTTPKPPPPPPPTPEHPLTRKASIRRDLRPTKKCYRCVELQRRILILLLLLFLLFLRRFLLLNHLTPTLRLLSRRNLWGILSRIRIRGLVMGLN